MARRGHGGSGVGKKRRSELAREKTPKVPGRPSWRSPSERRQLLELADESGAVIGTRIRKVPGAGDLIHRGGGRHWVVVLVVPAVHPATGGVPRCARAVVRPAD